MQTAEKDLEKEMEKFQILTFADILRALKLHPDWLEELRKLILTSELLELPKKVDELLMRFEKLEKKVDKIESDVEVLKQDVAILKQDVAVLKQDVAVLKQDVAVLKQDVAYLKGEFGRFKEKDFERTIREKYYAYFGRFLRKAKLIPFEEIIPILDEAEDKGLITEDDRDSILRLDILVSGQIKSTKKEVILAVEISYSLQEDDIERVLSRSDKLYLLLQKEVIPTIVVADAKEELQSLADEKGIFLIKAYY